MNFTGILLDILILYIPTFTVLSLVQHKISWLLIGCLFTALHGISNKNQNKTGVYKVPSKTQEEGKGRGRKRKRRRKREKKRGKKKGGKREREKGKEKKKVKEKGKGICGKKGIVGKGERYGVGREGRR